MAVEKPMNKIEFEYDIRSELPAVQESPASLGVKFVDTLDTLSRIDPSIFKNWVVMDLPARDSLPLAEARHDMSTIIERNVTRDDFRRPEPYYGYTANAFVGNVIKSRGIDLRIKAGGKSKGDTWLQTGRWNVLPDPTIVTYPLFKAALLAINANWPPRWACAFAFRSNTVKVPVSYPGGVQGYSLESLPMISSEPTFPESDFHIPWFTYLSPPLTKGLVLPAEILTERTADGGLLMIATEDRLDPNDPGHRRRARILAETMIERTGYASS